ncbi:hypothetical protein VP01_751g3 [Puccinia sorghi]|uniref:Uncharacterized protein n=1 Tax=Puccinia sorghi TaxID=27349 RepID=A0A0L6UD18_9BASI|nr:hypothetical protein VP01_751g3 [Puccinia sorghi]
MILLRLNQRRRKLRRENDQSPAPLKMKAKSKSTDRQRQHLSQSVTSTSVKQVLDSKGSIMTKSIEGLIGAINQATTCLQSQSIDSGNKPNDSSATNNTPSGRALEALASLFLDEQKGGYISLPCKNIKQKNMPHGSIVTKSIKGLIAKNTPSGQALEALSSLFLLDEVYEDIYLGFVCVLEDSKKTATFLSLVKTSNKKICRMLLAHEVANQ